MFYDNLKLICEQNGLKITPIVLECGGTKGVISGWKKGATPNSDIVMKLSVRLNVPTDILLFGIQKQSLINKLSNDEQELLKNYKNLSPFNKGKVCERAKTLAEIENEEKEKRKAKDIESHTNPGYIESYTLPASAGTGVDLDACEKIILEVKDSNLISEANFAIRISGDSMEPEFHNGQYALVKTKPQIEQGKIGIFTVNSDRYIKKLGADELISLNPEYDNIPLHEYDNVRCRGEVIGTLEPEDIL